MSRFVPHLFAVLLVLGAPAVGAAQSAKATSGGPIADRAELAREQSRLRHELEQTNTEIDALKRSRRVQDDYRLRRRMADAEALARRLTEIEAQLGDRQPSPPAGAPAPQPAPGDGPAELEAKADILADQSKRLLVQADQLATRAASLRARQRLRQRSTQMDRDPLAAFDGSKRRMVSGVAGPGRTPTVGGEKQEDPVPGRDSPSPATPEVVPGTAVPSTTVVGTSFTTQFRDFLDPGTMADIRKLETARGPGWEMQALERAAEAMRNRATQLSLRAEALRRQASPGR